MSNMYERGSSVAEGVFVQEYVRCATLYCLIRNNAEQATPCAFHFFVNMRTCDVTFVREEGTKAHQTG